MPLAKPPTWVVISDSRFEEAFGVFGVPWAHHLQARTVAIPGSEALGVLSSHPSRGSVGAPEHYGDRLQAGRHVVGFGSRVDHLVNGLHGEVEGHELTDGSETSLEKCRSLQDQHILPWIKASSRFSILIFLMSETQRAS